MYLMIFLGSVQRFQISGKCLSTRGVIPSCKCDTKLPTNGPPVVSVGDKPMYLAILCDLFGMVSSRDPLERLLVTSNWGIKRSLWHDRSRWKKTSWLGSWDDSAWEWDPVMSVTNILFAHTHNFNVWFVFILPEFPPKLPKCIDNDLGWSKCIVAKFISIPPRRWTLKNSGLEDEFPFPRVYYQVNHVNLPGCIIHNLQGYSNTAHSAEGSVHAEVTVPLLFKRWHAIL